MNTLGVCLRKICIHIIKIINLLLVHIWNCLWTSVHIFIVYKKNEQTKKQGRRYSQAGICITKTPQYLNNSAHELVLWIQLRHNTYFKKYYIIFTFLVLKRNSKTVWPIVTQVLIISSLFYFCLNNLSNF